MAAAVQQRVPLPLRRGNSPVSRVVCRYWKSGNCSRKPCRFLHADPPPPPPEGAAKKRNNTWLNPSSTPNPTTTSAAVPQDEQTPPTTKRGCRPQEEEPAWCVGDGICGVARLAGHAKAVTGVAVPDGSGTLFSGSLDGTVRAWDCGTGQCVGIAPIHEGEVSHLTAMGPWVLAGARGAVRALHTGSGEEHRLGLPAAGTRITALLADDDDLFAGTEDGAIYIWRLDQERRRFEEVAALHAGHAAVASLARGKGALYSGYADGGVMAWDLATRRRVCGFAGHASRVTALLCWDRFLLSASDDGTVKVWRSKQQDDHKDGVDPELEVHYTTHREEKEGDQRVVAMDGTHDADWKPVLLVARGDGVVRVYDLPSFKTRGEIRCGGEATAISLGTPGMVFIGDESGEVRVAKWTSAAAAAESFSCARTSAGTR